jgi:hypothetical protein
MSGIVWFQWHRNGQGMHGYGLDWINGAVMYVRQELFVPRCVLTHLHVSTSVSDGVLFLGSCFFSAPIIVIFLLEFQCI